MSEINQYRITLYKRNLKNFNIDSEYYRYNDLPKAINFARDQFEHDNIVLGYDIYDCINKKHIITKTLKFNEDN